MSLELIKNIGLLLGLVDFLLYVAFVWGKYGIQKSISISYYEWPTDEKFLFRLFIFILSSAIIISGIGWHIKTFLISGLLLSFVGIFSNINIKWIYRLHMIGAIGGILACFLGIILISLPIGLISAVTALIGFLLVILFGNRKNIIWDIEVICFSTLMASLLYINNM